MKDKKVLLPEEIEQLERKFRMIDERNSIALESDSDYIIVDEFSESKFGVQTGFNVKETKEEEKKEIVYAEEVFDEEIDSDDDIYAKVNKDRLIAKKYHRSPYEIGEDIDKTLLTHGFTGKVGLSLVSSMLFSRLIHFPFDLSNDEVIGAIIDTLSSEHFTVERNMVEGETIKDSEDFIKALEFAKNNINKPTFIYLPRLNAKEMFEYLKPVYSYIDSPEANCFVIQNDKSYIVSKNIFFIFTLEDGEKLSDMSRRILRYVSVVNHDLVKTPTNEEPVSLILSMEELNVSLRESLEKRILDESTWKKLDTLIVDNINPVSGFVLQNKIVRRLENYSSAVLTSPVEEMEALDITLANNFFNEAIVSKNVAGFLGTQDIFKALDSIFGAEVLPLSRKVIKEYLALFDKKGNRLDA